MPDTTNTGGAFMPGPFSIFDKMPTPVVPPGYDPTAWEQGGVLIPQTSPSSSTPTNINVNAHVNENPYTDLGSVLGAFSSGQKANRVVGGNFIQNFDQMMLGREQNMNNLMLQAQKDRNANESDALHKLRQTAYIQGRTPDAPTSITEGGKSVQLPQFSFAHKGSTPEEVAGAKTLQDTIMSRFGENGSYQPAQTYQPHDVNDYAKPGLAENLSSYGAAGVGGLGFLNKLDPSLLSKLGLGASTGANGVGNMASFLGGAPGLGADGADIVEGAGASGIGQAGSLMGNIMGKAVPLIGAGVGAYNLIKGGTTPSNIMNGATSGAGIGTAIMPGIGTGIGAGIGALVGGLRNIGHPSQQEVQGRQAASQIKSMLGSQATPQEQQEAAKAGWQNPGDALALIVVRDALQKSGKPPDAANQYMEALFKAEKQGPQAVQSAMQAIMGAMGTAGSMAPGQYRG